MNQELTDLDVGKVVDWIDGEIQSIEKQEPLAAQEDPQGPQDNVMIAAGQAFQESADDTDTEKINLPPETGKRKGKETIALPFLRRKAVKEDVEGEEEEDDKAVEKVDTDVIASAKEAFEKSIDGLKTWAFVEKAMGTPDEEPLEDSSILTAFDLDASFDTGGISKGTLLKEMLDADTRPSLEWWSACMDLAKEIPNVEERGAFATTLYHRTNEFDVSDFIEKTGGDDTSESGLNITVLGYQTKNFDICPGSVAAFRKIEDHLLDVRDPELRQDVVAAAKKIDTFLGLEKTLSDRGKADPNEIERMIKIYAHVAYLVGSIAERMGISLKNDFVFAINHINDVLPMMEREMALEKSLPPSAEQVYRSELMAKASSATGSNNSRTSSVTSGPLASLSAVFKDGDGTEEVDNLIYSEDDNVSLCKCGESIEKCGHKQDRADLESPSESGPMDRSDARPNIIMRGQACGCDHECPSPCKCEAILKEEIVHPDHIAAKNVTRAKSRDGDAGEQENSAGGDAPEGFGLSNDDEGTS